MGRLDVDTEGLLLLTNDGDLTHRLTHPSFGVEKEYLAEVERRPPTRGALRALREGVELEDGTHRAGQGEPRRRRRCIRLVIHEGRNRQVRRMCEAVGHPVRRLVRVRIGPMRRPAAARPGRGARSRPTRCGRWSGRRAPSATARRDLGSSIGASCQRSVPCAGATTVDADTPEQIDRAGRRPRSRRCSSATTWITTT